jgi:ribosomal protein S12 methylthiotransferase accessory factor
MLGSLAQSPAGLFRRPIEIYAGVDAPGIAISKVRCDLRHLQMPKGVRHANEIRAGGAGLTREDSELRAIAEAVERYSASVYTDDQFVVATANELAGECLDFDSIPRCSTAELDNDRCPLIRPDKHLPIRWVKSISLAERKMRFVPAVMVYSRLMNLMPGERFWFPISTGCSAHFGLNDAIVSGICEVIERDAISLTWLRELRHPRVIIDCDLEELRPYWNLYHRSSSAVEFEFYDATTDVGVPTIYGLRIAACSDSARTLVGCSTNLMAVPAIQKVFCDLVSLGTQLLENPKYPEQIADFKDLMHGAAYMADSRRESAFDFLRNNGKRVGLSSLLSAREQPGDLETLVERLRIRGMMPYVVDLTTDEANTVGMKVVRVIIPQLQPLSFHYLARYLGHARLFHEGIPGIEVDNKGRGFNVLPQPFA